MISRELEESEWISEQLNELNEPSQEQNPEAKIQNISRANNL